MTTQTLPGAFREAASRFKNRTAVVFAGKRTDYQTLDRLTDRGAASLASHGLRAGDRIGLYCPNSEAFVIAYFSILKAGGTVVPINLLLNPKESAYILNDSGAKALIYFEGFAANVGALASLTPEVTLRVMIGSGAAPKPDISWTDFLDSSALLPAVSIDPGQDLAALLYTSGTTGFPKGAMLTHANLLSNVESVWEAVKLETAQEVFLVVLPMFHAFAATACMLTPLLHGCTIVPLPRFEPAHVADTIQAESATIFMAVPSMFSVLLRLPDEYTPKFRSLKLCISGGAALPVEVMKRFEERFGIAIYEGDGPTECSPVTCVNPIGGERKPGSVGPSVPRVEMKIMDDQGNELSQGQVGELCVRGSNVMKGYWKRPDDTREAFFGEWFRTGDLGMVDADGYFYIVDRKKDLIIVNGMNVYPRVIEEVLYKHPAVREAAVVGESHELHGEIPVACIAVKEGMSVSAEEMRSFCRENLGRYEVPRKVRFMPELPKNAAGKIIKRALRNQGEVERGVAPEAPM